MGKVSYPTMISVAADFSNTIAINKLSLGVNMGHDFDFAKWRNDISLRNKVVACNFGLIRIFVHEVQPCFRWDEEQASGEYSWDLFDRTIERVLEIGAEPLLAVASGNWETRYWLPSGMKGNSQGSKFPSNESFGTFCANLVRHCNVDKNWGIKYWEVWNEPTFSYYNETTGISYVDSGRIANFTRLFNKVAQSMHGIDPNVLCGHGFSAIQSFFDYFLANSDGLGFLSIHDYDTHATKYYRPDFYKEENEIMVDASSIGYLKPGIWETYTPRELRQKWSERRGQQLPVLITEANVNSVYVNGTDPRMQTIFAAAWYAEKLRSAMLEGITYSAYFVLASDHSPYWNTTEPTRGYGFGMINSTYPYEEWYPYYTSFLLGPQVHKGDEISSSSSHNLTAISTLAWKTGTHYNLLLIGKTTSRVTAEIAVQGTQCTSETSVSILRIDGNYEGVQSATCKFNETIHVQMDGYSIILLQIPL
jgi:hypothetical protein